MPAGSPIREGKVTGRLNAPVPAFAVPLPKFIVRLQRRDAFRIETPRIRPLEFFGRLPDGRLLKLPAHDISVAGIGLAVYAAMQYRIEKMARPDIEPELGQVGLDRAAQLPGVLRVEQPCHRGWPDP